ncbi:hypothetical protein [Bradyrhizobium stylosanthis]|uniref:Uncharacterized protein n=1 Tax=Bradyrhizobium stylosanthis TaxID=1803665 RepID=A0A560ECY0_9BRAD|nr:hypothetical protein [Bradyrhizobium stylosanthis]TWB07184.1 hypothetical protein FBZ96_1011002 [Bradyrhizobium stylosanthis]
MNNGTKSLLTCSAAIFCLMVDSAHAKGPYTPQQALHNMYDQIRTLLGYDPVDNPGARSTWLGLSYIGDAVASNDPQKINDLANTCPEVSPLTNFTSLERLDSVYERMIKGMVGPNRPETPEVKAAKESLFSNGANTPKYTTYLGFQQQHDEALRTYLQAATANDRVTASQRMALILQNWQVSGDKIDVEGALFRIKTQQSAFSDATNLHRLNVLDIARQASWASTEVAGAFRSPVSEVSPPVGNWQDADGWVKVLYSEDSSTMNYTASNSSSKGFAGLGLGFVNIVGTTGGGNSSQSRVTKIDAMSYTFEIKVITIRRPWLDSEVFSVPLGWTWRTNPNTTAFPRVSDGPNADDLPVVPAKYTYDNAAVHCPLIPTAMVIARNRVLTLTSSRSTYDEVNRAGSQSVGGSFMGIFGGGQTKTWTTTVINTSGDNMTYKIEAPGTGVIGFISTKLKRLPDPNLNDSWPSNAMKP